jgi:SpoVK/Ycf46/Vps4 family AAA+-type ATPase
LHSWNDPSLFLAGDRTVQKQRRANVSPYASDLEYIEDELRWIELRTRRIHAEMRTGAETEDDWSDEAEPGAEQLMELVESYRRIEERARRAVDRRLDRTRKAGIALGLDALCVQFGLSAHERTILLLASGISFTTRFARLYSALEGGSRRSFSSLAVEAIYTFLELGFSERIHARKLFEARSPLRANELVSLDVFDRFVEPHDLLRATVTVTAQALDRILGVKALNEAFEEFSSLESPRACLDQVVLDEQDKRRILSVLENHREFVQARHEWGFDEIIRYGRGIGMLFSGRPGTGKTMMAHAIAQHLGKRILNVDVPTFLEASEAGRYLPRLFRAAAAHDAVLFFDECEPIFASRRRGNLLMNLLLTELERFEGILVLATNQPEALDEALDRRLLVKVVFPEPDRDARLEIWRKHLPARAPLAADVDLETLATRYECAGGYIKNAVLMAVATAVQEHGASARLEMRHLDGAIREQLRRPSNEGSRLVNPRSRLEHVVLSEPLCEQVRELVQAARDRRTVLGRWGIGAHFSHGKGLAALFHGPPGTGKTLCAEAVAGELGRPLLRCAAAQVLSKWVGETENNLAALFSEARTHAAVLFFDEADSLLADRGGSGALRHDVMAVNVLLELVERHEGVVLLATNRREALDPALHRRLAYVLEFPLPDASARAGIWQGLLPPSVPLAEPIDFAWLGRRFELSGGEIYNAVMRAAYRAARSGESLSQSALELAAADVLGADPRKRTIGFARSA